MLTGLPDSSVVVVIASQSFHWFANTSALREINRVLVPGGMFGIFSVMPDYSVPWMTDLWEFQAPLYKEKSIVRTDGNGFSAQRPKSCSVTFKATLVSIILCP